MTVEKQYIVRVPNNKEYNGVTCGVRFYGGEALVAPHTISPYLGWTIDQIVWMFRKDFGYEVTEVLPDDFQPGVPPAGPARESKPKAKRKTTKKDVTK